MDTDTKMHHGGLMSAMRRAGNSIRQFRFEMDGAIYSGEELADYFDRTKAEEKRPPAESIDFKERRRHGLELFKQADFAGSAAVFGRLAQESKLRKDWFNLFSALLHLGEPDRADLVLQEMRNCPLTPNFEECLSPPEEGFHAARLFIENGRPDLGARELIGIADCYTSSADDTFLYMRRIPMFGHVIQLIELLESKLTEVSMHDFTTSFSSSIGQEARELLQNRRKS